MTCDKKRYDNRAAAESKLRYILSNSKRAKKPNRGYLSHKCNGWHLTSMSQSELDKLINKFRGYRQKRIEREANYWLDRLGSHE